MLKRRHFLWFLAVTALFLAVMFRYSTVGEGPRYLGRSASQWFNDRTRSQGDYDAFVAMGSNAVPFLLTKLKSEDSFMVRAYWSHWRSLPVWVRRLAPLPRLPNSARERAVSILTAMGSAGAAATPSIIDLREQDLRQRRRLSPRESVDWTALFEVARWADRDQIGSRVPGPEAFAGVTNQAGLMVPGGRANAAMEFIRQSEARALVEMGGADPRLMPLLLFFLHDGNSGFVVDLGGRMRGSKAMVECARHSEPLLESALQDQEPTVRLTAAHLLLKVRPQRSELVQYLFEGLEDSAPGIKAGAADSLTEVRTEPAIVVPRLLDLLRAMPIPEVGARSPDGFRERIVDGLAGLGSDNPAALGLLSGALQDTNPAVRSGACASLRSIGPRAIATVPRLRELTEFSGETNLETRFEAALALWTVAGEGDPAARIFASLCAVPDRDARWNLLAFWGNSEIPGAPIVPTVSRILSEDDSNRLRAKAAVVLGRFGKDSVPAIPVLEKAQQDEFPNVRRAATEALDRIRQRP